MRMHRAFLLLVGLVVTALPKPASAITGSGVNNFIARWTSATNVDTAYIFQYADPSGNGRYFGINHSVPNGVLGLQCRQGYDIFGQDSAHTFNIASHGSMYLQPGVRVDGSAVSNSAANKLSLGAGGVADLAVLDKKRLTVSTNVGVGLGVAPDTNFATGFRLKVCGTIKAKGITTDATGWCDYVFKPGYELMPLDELEASIQENGHLPEIPTEAEVTENGIELGSMTTKLLKKVEELTLYVIELKKANDKLAAQVATRAGR